MHAVRLRALTRRSAQVIGILAFALGVSILPVDGQAATSFKDRARHILLHESSKDRNHAKLGFHYAIARFALGRDIEKALQIVDKLTDQLTGNDSEMFRYYPAIAAYLRYKHLYPPKLRVKTKAKMMIWRGGTLCGTCGTYNQQVLKAVATYLIKQAWPTYTGNGRAARRKLLTVMRRIVTKGMSESDSPTYHLVYVNAFLLICELSAEPAVRQRACLTVDALLANIAPQWLRGYWISSNARDQNRVLSPEDSAQGAIMAWLYFSGTRAPNLDGHPAEAYAVVIPATSPYRVPPIIRRIAQDRRKPFVHKESHAPDGAIWEPYTATVRRYSFVAPFYGVASQREVGGPPGFTRQLSRWFVRWVSSRPGSTFFLTVPSTGRIHYQGSSPFEQTLQNKGTLLAVYNQPAQAAGVIEGPVSRESVLRLTEASGWIFIHGGAVLIGVRTVKPYEWTADRTIFGRRYRNVRSRGRRNGIVVETAPRESYSGGGLQAELERFSRAVLRKTSLDASHIDKKKPRLIFRNLAGQTLDITYGGPHRIDGRVIDYGAWPLLKNPWMKQDFGQRRLAIGHGSMKLNYDYKRWLKFKTR